MITDTLIQWGGYALSGVIGIVALWWKDKTPKQKKELVKDTFRSLKDGKISGDEFEELIDEHL
jgi:O-phosphoseryl-tRNA(Cys) synthetase